VNPSARRSFYSLLSFKLGKSPRNGFNGQRQIVCDVPSVHRQIDGISISDAAGDVDKKILQSLFGGLSAEKQHVHLRPM